MASKSTRFFRHLLVALSVAGGIAEAAVIGPVAVSSPQGSRSGFPLTEIIDQSGLSANYVSGVTDFNTFTAATTNPGGISQSGFTAAETSGPQQFTFDLGDFYLIDSIAIWNSGSAGSVISFEVQADSDANYGNGTTVSVLSPTALDTGFLVAQVFTFAPVSTRYVHVNGLASQQPPDFYGLGEVIFNGVPVPEPTTLGATGFGLLALLHGYRRTRN